MATFDRFDICSAYHVFATRWHGGQFTDTYRIFGRLTAIGFELGHGRSVGTLASLSGNAREIYDALVEGDGEDPTEYAS